MKYLAVLLAIFIGSTAHAFGIEFRWDPNEDLYSPHGIIYKSGYKIHYGVESRNYTDTVDVGLPEIINGRVVKSIEIIGDEGKYFAAATAYINDKESDYSNEVSWLTSYGLKIINFTRRDK